METHKQPVVRVKGGQGHWFQSTSKTNADPYFANRTGCVIMGFIESSWARQITLFDG